ncbi:phenylacetate--CoA ligase family protein [Pendulispora rubella]|uniref:Phenylacetate--CoA ligase family protein n=1 Tax=Pendulispora rubella TaxID=2741070 RepID=A0ABZ2KWJ8_9BACT
MASPLERALGVFHETVAQVPAYRTFLAEQGVAAEQVRDEAAFRALPLMTKENYFRRFPLDARCRQGALARAEMIAVSSGSTGEPTFWPRTARDEALVAERFEQVFRDSFRADERTTLAVICFPLGTWVGGMYTTSGCRALTAKGQKVTVITPGNNKDEILRVVAALAPSFEQVVLLGYPPFLKDVVDTARARGIDLRPWQVKLVLAGEVVSEEWRTLLAERLGQGNILQDSASLYGTADAGVLATETPLSIALRRFFAAHPDLARERFGESRLPTLAQYDPLARYLEERDGTLLFTADGGVPLVRYHIADTGGIADFGAMMEFARARGFLLPAELESGDRGVREMPFVWVFGRSHFTVSFFGANVFPENVTVALEEAPIHTWVTGKFVLMAEEDAQRDRRLRLVVELAPGVAASDDKIEAIAASVVRALVLRSSEFAHYVPKERQRPEVMLAPAGDPSWFPVGVKHRYTRNARSTSH